MTDRSTASLVHIGLGACFTTGDGVYEVVPQVIVPPRKIRIPRSKNYFRLTHRQVRTIISCIPYEFYAQTCLS